MFAKMFKVCRILDDFALPRDSIFQQKEDIKKFKSLKKKNFHKIIFKKVLEKKTVFSFFSSFFARSPLNPSNWMGFA